MVKAGLSVSVIAAACLMLVPAQLSAQPWTTSGSNIYYTGGKVGIGTNVPSIPLEVSGAMGPTATENISGASGQLALNSNSGVAVKVGITTVATFNSGGGSSSSLTLGSGSYPRLYFGSTGHTLIGPLSFPGWLDIVNSGPIAIRAGSSYLLAAGNSFLSEDNTFIGAGDQSSGYRMFGAVWSRSGGNGQLSMGVSTLPAPYAGGNLLLVAGGNESGAYGHASQSDPTLIVHSRTAAGTATNQWLSFQHDTSDGVIQTGTGSLILSPANGYVGIGTAVPCAGSISTCRLAVKGAIRANEVVVDTGWSDYVFDHNYPLQPLSEVAEFVAANHHLPDIPSAKEVAEKGVNLGDMQAKLLAKIEELTLHQIQAERRISELEKSNQELQRRLTSSETIALSNK
jgi:hypothetical protein